MKTRIQILRFFSGLTLLLVALAFGACGKDSPSDPGTGAPPADVNAYLATLPTWDQFSPPMADADVPTGPASADVETIGGEDYNCTTTPYSITRTPDRVVTLNPDVEILYTGSLLQGKGHLGGIGSLAELPIRQRAPITLSIDLLTGNNTEVVNNPTVASVNSAVGALIQAAQDAGHTAGSNIFFTQETTHSMVQAALDMGISASYMGASIKASLSSNISDETRTVTAYFVQRMFSVSMVLPQTPGEVFSSAFTTDKLQEQIDRGRIGEDNLPVFVSSVSYGRILMFSFTSTASIADIKATLEALYNGGEFGGNLSTELKSVLDSAEIQVVTVGGDASSALALIRANDLGAYFAEDSPLTTARPISYTVRNLGDNSIASVSETTDYNLKTCSPAASVITGSNYNIRFTKAKVIELSLIDVCAPWNYYTECFQIELQYTIHVETTRDGVVTPLNYSATVLHPYAAALKEGETLVLPSNSTDVQIHYDGRGDYVRVWGEMRDWDTATASDKLPFFREFKYPAKTMPTGETYVDATDSAGSKVRLYFTITKGQDLDD
ncbi:MAG TPA: thiol-activated cytolysin family protein [Candidatus Krumholzibacteria bacterium]|nr:thiol-activated cytolysin family protein [Candidatus Krumholzibacteria bacterium]